MKNLIVSADDFGLTKSLNEGIVKAYAEGIVTSINLLSTGGSFEDSVYMLKELHLKEIGAHLSLTETRPITDPKKIPSLTDKDGAFRKNYIEFFRGLFLGRIKYDEIRLELGNQLDRLKKTGIPISSINSHEHIHMMPRLLKIFIDLAKEYNIPFIRYPHGDCLVGHMSLKKFFRLQVLLCLRGKMGAMIRGAGLRTSDNFMGLLDSGNLQEGTLLELLKNLKDGTTELVCHPGFISPEMLDRCIFHLKCEGELSAITSKRVKQFIIDNGIRLVDCSGISKA